MKRGLKKYIGPFGFFSSNHLINILILVCPVTYGLNRIATMSLETRKTKTSLHQMGKSMLLQTQYTDTQGRPYQHSTQPEDQPLIPDPNIFDSGESQIDKTSAVLPRISECAVHLELLETFFVLRQNVFISKSIDKAMDIKPNRETKTGFQGDTKTFKDETLWHRRQKKWTKYVECATIRFLAWRADFNKSGNTVITDATLPPLDVIMIWHSFLLNPKLFLSSCRDQLLFSVRFPWACIHKAIDNGKWIFKARSTAKFRYESKSKLPWDLFKHLKSWGASLPSLPFSSANMDVVFPDTNPSSPDHGTVSKERSAAEYTRLFQKVDQQLCPKLRDAVIRQTKFVDKMNARMWIRSPALHGTLERAIDRYTKFCELLKISKKNVMVPTLDIDLVWHTHQCSAKYYGQGMKILCGKFINHDDTIAQGTLGDGADKTRGLFRQKFGQEYRICGCWDCEALLSALEDFSSDEEGLSMASIVANIKEKVAYYRAVEMSRRRGNPLPVVDCKGSV